MVTMPSTETGTSSPRGALSRLKRNKGLVNASNNSLGAGSADGDDYSEGGKGIRASMDAALEKVKDKTKRRSVDDRRGSEDMSSKRLSSFIPGKKRASKKDAPGLERNLSAQSAGDSVSFISNRSETSLLDESGHSSLLTDDNSDMEGYVKPLFFV